MTAPVTQAKSGYWFDVHNVTLAFLEYSKAITQLDSNSERSALQRLAKANVKLAPKALMLLD